jgi:transglutaminase-like putative cysteine protease
MRIRAGYELTYHCPQPLDMFLMVSVHQSRAHDLLTEGQISFSQGSPPRTYQDRFNNICTRVLAAAGTLTISTEFIIGDTGNPDPVPWRAPQHPIAELPNDVLIFLLASRYCETDRMTGLAWGLFGHIPPGYGRVDAILQFVHDHIRFDYQLASSTRSAWGAYRDGVGVCRDFTHLAVTFCRCLNIPARYCTGYLGDIRVPLAPYPMDFSAWFEVYLGGAWYTCDARHYAPRIGRVLMAVGRDAIDVAISTSFGSAPLAGFHVITEEVG